MKVLLNRDIKNLGKVGEVVVVKDGYGRNFLLSKGYAKVATKANIMELEKKIEELKKNNDALSATAKKVADLLDKEVFNTVRQAADDDTIYGSIRTKDIYNYICELLKKNSINFTFDIGGIKIKDSIKSLGQYIIGVELFGNVETNLRLNVCRAMADFESDPVAFDKKMEKALQVEKDNKTDNTKAENNK